MMSGVSFETTNKLKNCFEQNACVQSRHDSHILYDFLCGLPVFPSPFHEFIWTPHRTSSSTLETRKSLK